MISLDYNKCQKQIIGKLKMTETKTEDQLTYAIVESFDMDRNPCLLVSFCYQSFWEQNNCIPSEHMSKILLDLGLPDDFCNQEEMENTFVFDKDSNYSTKEKIVETLDSLGLVRNYFCERYMAFEQAENKFEF
jgi:hypothetical protein